MVVDGSGSDWATLAPTFNVESSTDGVNDGVRLDAGGSGSLDVVDDYTALLQVASDDEVAALLTRRTGNEPTADEIIFFSPAGLPKTGYEMADGRFAVAMTYNGIGYRYGGTGRSGEWKWIPLDASEYDVVRSGRVTEVKISKNVWSNPEYGVDRLTPISVVGALVSDSGTPGNPHDDVVDFVPNTEVKIGGRPSGSTYGGVPPLVVDVNNPGLGADVWAPGGPVLSNPLYNGQWINDGPDDGLPPQVGAPAISPGDRNDYKALAYATDGVITSAMLATYGEAGEAPMSDVVQRVYFAPTDPSQIVGSGYEVEPGVVAVAMIEDGIGYLWVDGTWQALPMSTRQHGMATHGNMTQAWMANAVWADAVVGGTSEPMRVVGALMMPDGTVDYVPDLERSVTAPPPPPPGTTTAGSVTGGGRDSGSGSGLSDWLLGMLLALLALCCCCCLFWLLFLCCRKKEEPEEVKALTIVDPVEKVAVIHLSDSQEGLVSASGSQSVLGDETDSFSMSSDEPRKPVTKLDTSPRVAAARAAAASSLRPVLSVELGKDGAKFGGRKAATKTAAGVGVGAAVGAAAASRRKRGTRSAGARRGDKGPRAASSLAGGIAASGDKAPAGEASRHTDMSHTSPDDTVSSLASESALLAAAAGAGAAATDKRSSSPSSSSDVSMSSDGPDRRSRGPRTQAALASAAAGGAGAAAVASRSSALRTQESGQTSGLAGSEESSWVLTTETDWIAEGMASEVIDYWVYDASNPRLNENGLNTGSGVGSGVGTGACSDSGSGSVSLPDVDLGFSR